MARVGYEHRHFSVMSIHAYQKLLAESFNMQITENDCRVKVKESFLRNSQLVFICMWESHSTDNIVSHVESTHSKTFING